MTPQSHLSTLLARYPVLEGLEPQLNQAFSLLEEAFRTGHKLILAGNGGSCADAEHIAGELMKGFVLPRPLTEEMQQRLLRADPDRGAVLARSLQQGLPCIALSSHPALNTAFLNDVDGGLMFAQQLSVLGNAGDVFLAISTSGNSQNIYDAAVAAKAKGMKVLALTGKTGGQLKSIADLSLIMPCGETFMIQELHLPVYHCLCLMLEAAFFGD